MPERSRAPWFAVVALVSGCGGAAAPPPESPVNHADDASRSPNAAQARAPSTPERADAEPESAVSFSFEPLASGIRPGGTVVLAARVRIAQGYRISWKTAGEVGSPTVVTFRAPPGFEVGPALFPAPERFTVPGGYGGIGYANETAVFAVVKAPARLGRADVSRFDVEASWVACKKVCNTERGAAFVELATTYGDARVHETENAVAPFRARIPKPFADVPGASAEWQTTPKDATLVLAVKDTTAKDFIAEDGADPKPDHVAVKGGAVRAVFDEAPHAGSRPLRGVLVVSGADGKEAYFDVEAPLPGAPKAEKPAPRGRGKKR